MNELRELARRDAVDLRFYWPCYANEVRAVLHGKTTVVWEFENRTYAVGPNLDWVQKRAPDVLDGKAVLEQLDCGRNPFHEKKVLGVELTTIFTQRAQRITYAAENGQHGSYRRANLDDRARLKALGARESISAELLLTFDFAASADRLVVAPGIKEVECEWTSFAADAGWARLDIHIAWFPKEKANAFWNNPGAGWDGGDVRVFWGRHDRRR